MSIATIDHRDSKPTAGPQCPDQCDRVPARYEHHIRITVLDCFADPRNINAPEAIAMNIVAESRFLKDLEVIPFHEGCIPHEWSSKTRALLLGRRLCRIQYGQL